MTTDALGYPMGFILTGANDEKISKLPIRQLTVSSAHALIHVFSKLPIRQLTSARRLN